MTVPKANRCKFAGPSSGYARPSCGLERMREPFARDFGALPNARSRSIPGSRTRKRVRHPALSEPDRARLRRRVLRHAPAHHQFAHTFLESEGAAIGRDCDEEPRLGEPREALERFPRSVESWEHEKIGPPRVL